MEIIMLLLFITGWLLIGWASEVAVLRIWNMEPDPVDLLMVFFGPAVTGALLVIWLTEREPRWGWLNGFFRVR